MAIFRILALPAAAAAILVSGGASAQAAGDPVKGKAIFPRCMICHDLKPGVNRLGPSLAGVFGRKAGTVPGFAYSSAMKGAKIVWNAKSLDGYLTKPSTYVPGNKMVFVGLPKPEDRANLIAYLEQATK